MKSIDEALLKKVDPAILKEIDTYEENMKKFLAGTISTEAFQRHRLQHGVYGQRQDGVQMIRIKIPMGILNAEQVECIADLAEEIAHNNAHITTRQDLQIHYVNVRNTPYLMRKLATVGITTREACGNTVRNVTASPSAGVDPKEVFDVTPYAHAMTYHLIRNPICQNLPRKFKIAFDGGGVMTALPFMHDLGLTARIENGKRGFQMVVGGGLGSSPRIAKTLHEFIEAEEIIPWAQSLIRLFDRFGERKTRSKARMKFLIDKLGWEEFRKAVVEERAALEVDPSWNEYLKTINDWDVKAPQVKDTDIPNADETDDYRAWKKTNTWEQKQKGYSMVEIRLTTGDMNPSQMRGFANILRRYSGGQVRAMVHQNFLIPWIRTQDLPSLYQELKGINFVKKDAQTIYDITSCPGTDTCRLGIASSMGLSRELEKKLYEENGAISQVAKDINIRISGCPNSCGQHHIANIGFHGGALPNNGHTAPSFQLFLGGSPGREMSVGQLTCHVPSKNAPAAVIKLSKNYAEKKKGNESFNEFYAKYSKDDVKNLLGELLKVPTFEENPSFYKDWEDTQEFGLQKGVIGECAGSSTGTDRPPMVRDGEELLNTATALLTHEEFEAASHKAYESIVKAAEGLLHYRLVQTFNDIETTHEFENHFVKTGLFPEWKNFHKEIQSWRKEPADEVKAKAWVAKAKDFLAKLISKETQVAENSPRKGAATGLQPDNLAI